MATIENAKEAFAGESQANRKYLAFSEKAAEKGSKTLQPSTKQPLKQKQFMQKNS